MNPIRLPREIQELLPLPDEEIKGRLNQDAKLVAIFNSLKKDQISHVEKPLAERFLHIIEQSTIDPVIKDVLIRDFRSIGGIGTDLSESELEEIIEKNSRKEIVSNWAYFSENNKKQILFLWIRKDDFGELFYLIDNADVDLNILSDDGTPLLFLIYDWIFERKTTEALLFESRLDIFEALIEKGANLKIKSKNDETLFERAIINGDSLFIEKITKLGANPNDVDQNGLPLLHLAYKLAFERPESSSEEEDENYRDIFLGLLEIDGIDLTVKDSDENTVVQLATHGRSLRKDRETCERILNHKSLPKADKIGYCLIVAFQDSDWKEIERLLQSPSINLTVKDAYGITPLHLLCRDRSKSKQAIAALLREQPNANVKDSSGTSPLHIAFTSGNIDVLIVLLKLGARQDVLDSRGDAPIHNAFHSEHFELIEQLLGNELFNPNIRDSKGKTVLQQACIKGNAKLVKALLKHPSVDPYFEDNQTEHVVDMTHFLSDAAIMKIFFAHPKINEADKNGYRLLIACQKKDWKEALRLLKEKEINPNFKDSYGRPPLLMAYEEANLDVVQALLQRDEIDPNFIDQNEKSFLIRVYDSFAKGMRGSYVFGEGVFQNLLHCKNTDLNQKNREGTSLIHLVYLGGNRQLFNQLLDDPRVDPNIEDPTLGHLLALAYKKMDISGVKKILSNPRTNPNVRLSNGVPLIITIFSRHDTTLIDKLLQDDRVDFNVKNRHGHTVLHQALLQRNTDLVKKLLSHKRVDPNSRANNGDLIFDEVVRYDMEKNRLRVGGLDPQNPDLALNLFLKHPRLTKADRNGYLLFLAMQGRNWDLASEILKEAEINVHLKPYLTIALRNQKLEVARELLRRGFIPSDEHLLEACEKNNRELALLLFDAGAEFDPYDTHHGKLILEVLFPVWNWEGFFDGSDTIMEQYQVLKSSGVDANPLESFFIIFPDPIMYQLFLESLTEAEQTHLIDGARRTFPNRALFLDLQTKYTPPEKPKKNLPDIRKFSLDKAIAVYKKCYDRINFRDPKGPGYIDPEMILDQGESCSEEDLRRYGENFCLYMRDPANSKYAQEKTDSKSYQGLREKFRYVMYHMAQEYDRLEKDSLLTADEKVRLRKNIDNLLMLIASSGNHCIIAKNDVLEEGLDKAYGVGYIPSLENQIAHIIHRYRLGIIEMMFTDEDTDPPQVLSHDMYAFMLEYEEELGVLIEAFVRDDPFLEGITPDLKLLEDYEVENIPEKLVRFIAKELQQKGSEVSPETLKKWLSENPPKTWNAFDEILFDIEGMSSHLGYAYLARNFSLSPTAEELLELVNPPDLAIHREKCREITEEVGQKYQRIKKDKELEIQSKKEALENMEGPIVQQTQEEMNRIRLEIPLLYAKRIEEQNRRKMSYLQEQGILLSPKEYVLALKRTEDISVIKKEMHGKKVEDQWEVLEAHNIHRIDPMEVLSESGKTGVELDAITRELMDKSQEASWEVLAKHKIPNPNPKTPFDALEKYRAQQYANQAYVEGRVRLDRIVSLLVFTKQLKIADS